MQFNEITSHMTERILEFTGDKFISRGQIHLINNLSGYIAEENNDIAGVILYNIINEECEIISLDSFKGTLA